ncbi:hypothetical protein JRQ81_019364, partial [Phrynocephalus forsythii]
IIPVFLSFVLSNDGKVKRLCITAVYNVQYKKLLLLLIELDGKGNFSYVGSSPLMPHLDS